MNTRKGEATHRVIPINPQDFAPDKFAHYKIGAPRKLTPEQAALVFESLVQISAAQKLIDRTLAVAGISAKSRGHALTCVWRSRGRVDIPLKLLTPALGTDITPLPGYNRRASIPGGRR